MPGGTSDSDARSNETPSTETQDARGGTSGDGAGCFPAVLAATVLMGIVMCITFGFAGYAIFQKRGDLAVRTLRGTMLSEIEQSRLDPETKQAVAERLSNLADDIESNKLGNWEAGGAMNRLVRSPLLRWGDLVAVDAWASQNLPTADYPEFHKQITRFYRAAELDRAISTDIHDLLLSVTAGDPNQMLGRLKPTLTDHDVRQVGLCAKLVADRAEIPDQVFDAVSLTKIVDRLIEVGIREGST